MCSGVLVDEVWVCSMVCGVVGVVRGGLVQGYSTSTTGALNCDEAKNKVTSVLR